MWYSHYKNMSDGTITAHNDDFYHINQRGYGHRPVPIYKIISPIAQATDQAAANVKRMNNEDSDEEGKKALKSTEGYFAVTSSLTGRGGRIRKKRSNTKAAAVRRKKRSSPNKKRKVRRVTKRKSTKKKKNLLRKIKGTYFTR